VRLGGLSGIQLYAEVSTSSKISELSADTLQQLEHLPAIKAPTLQLLHFSGGSKTKLVSISLILCNPDFEPWIDFGQVPFVTRKYGKTTDSTSRVLLGFDSCLSRLRIEIDYPQRLLVVTSRSLQRIPGEIDLAPAFPTRITEGETLIDMGSYAAAVAVIATAVEEALVPVVGRSAPYKGATSLLKQAARIPELDLELLSQLETITRWRNTAVHGSPISEISKEDAEWVLHAAKSVMLRLSQFHMET
jgi:hypothetical protein